MHLLAGVAAIAAVFYLSVVAYLFSVQRRLLYRPNHPWRSQPELGHLAALGVSEVTLETADGLLLRSWYLPSRDGRPVIVYFHGNGGHIGHRAERLQRFAGEGYGVLMVEYRGYGGNPGTPSETGLYRDADAALAFLGRDGIAPDRLVLYGESLGCGVAVWAAVNRSVAALVLESPCTSVAAAAQYHYPFVPAIWLVLDRFDSLSRMARVRAPILVLQGMRDAIIPVAQGETVFAAAPEPKELWRSASAGHEDLARFGALEAVIGFIEKHLGRTRAIAPASVQ